MNSSSHEGDVPVPPLIPKNETQMLADPELRDTCLTMLHKINKDWSVTDESYSRSEQWGDILRVDFAVPGIPVAEFVNRAICWRDPINREVSLLFAMGEEIPPLKNY